MKLLRLRIDIALILRLVLENQVRKGRKGRFVIVECGRRRYECTTAFDLFFDFLLMLLYLCVTT